MTLKIATARRLNVTLISVNIRYLSPSYIFKHFSFFSPSTPCCCLGVFDPTSKLASVLQLL